MYRRINLRQVEAFKAVIENGTTSRAAELLNMSQPGVSKLLAHLEMDTGLKLFDRHKGRLIPTEDSMLLYDEVGRIFAGVRQVENAVEAIRREKQGRVAVGVMPALAGPFIQQGVATFVREHKGVFCSVQSLSSTWILDLLIARKLDVGLVDAGLDNPYVQSEPLMKHPVVCIMPLDHPFTAKTCITPQDLDGVAFVAPHPDTYVGDQVRVMLEEYGVHPRMDLVANVAPTLCGLVAAGLGVSLVPPLSVSGLEHCLAVRRFEPAIMYNFQLCRSADSRNADMVEKFAQALRDTAARASSAVLRDFDAGSL